MNAERADCWICLINEPRLMVNMQGSSQTPEITVIGQWHNACTVAKRVEFESVLE